MNEAPLFAPLIAIGGSAGSLQPLLDLLYRLTRESPLCRLLVATHLSHAEEKDLLRSIQSRIDWPVEWVQDKMTLSTRVAYVVPPNYHAEWQEGQVMLIPIEADDQWPAPSLHQLFRSMAVGLGHRAIGVLLSGTGDDGALGGRTLQQLGGHLMLQSPKDAELTGEEYHAAQATPGKEPLTGPHQLADELLYHLAHLNHPDEAESNSEDLRRILQLLTRKTGTNFNQYKTSTLIRRLTKCQEAVGAATLAGYYTHLQEHPEEVDTLFQTLLIKVTQFFRDELSFEALRTLLSELIADKRQGDSLRLWSVGCATGEEAYSLAIMVDELLGPHRDMINVQIFATELDPVALEKARVGRYTAEQVKGLSSARLNQYFTSDEDGYRIRKSIRKMILFSQHDITTDTPFVRLDLVTCRNLLIYFTPSTQREVLPVFHYALREKGFLFLGRSENVSPFADLFARYDYPHKIFQRKVGTSIYTLRFTRFQQSIVPSTHPQSPYQERPQSLMDWVHKTLLEQYPYPYAVVNEHMSIQETRGSLRPFLEIAEGRLSAHLLHLIVPNLHTDLQAILLQARRQGTAQVSRPLLIDPQEPNDLVRLRVIPVQDLEQGSHYFIVLFERITGQALPAPGDGDSEEWANLRISNLEEELTAAREHLRTFIDELETSKEELQALNGEIQSANEELKSANEELETSNEELQSANEEMETANSELRHTNDQLTEAETLLLATQRRMKLEKRIMAEGQKIAQFCHWMYAYETHAVQTSPFFASTVKLPPDTEFRTIEDVLSLFPEEAKRQSAQQAVQDRSPFSLTTVLPVTAHRPQPMRIEAVGRLIEDEMIEGDLLPYKQDSSYYILIIRMKDA